MCTMAHYAILQDAPYGLLWQIMLWYEACLTACYGTIWYETCLNLCYCTLCCGMRQALQIMLWHIMLLYETGLTVCVMAHCAVVRVCVRPFSLKLQYACIQPGLTVLWYIMRRCETDQTFVLWYIMQRCETDQTFVLWYIMQRCETDQTFVLWHIMLWYDTDLTVCVMAHSDVV